MTASAEALKSVLPPNPTPPALDPSLVQGQGQKAYDWDKGHQEGMDQKRRQLLKGEGSRVRVSQL